jgi:hypothetical protein
MSPVVAVCAVRLETAIATNRHSQVVSAHE